MHEQKAGESKRTGIGRKTRRDPPWNVILHNDWDNPMPRVVIVLRKSIPGLGLAKAVRIMYTAHSTGRAAVKSCHRELAELYQERLRSEGLTVSIEPSS